MKLLRKMMVSALVALCIFATSCKNYDEEIANMKTEVETMKTTLASFGRRVLAVENINDKTFSKRIATLGVFTIRIQTESEIVSKKALNF